MTDTGCQAKIKTARRYTAVGGRIVRSHPICGREVKGTLADGTPVCGIHLNAEKMRLTKEADRDLLIKRREAVTKALGILVTNSPCGDRYATVRLVDLEKMAAHGVGDDLREKCH
jgi:hypothetical protein